MIRKEIRRIVQEKNYMSVSNIALCIYILIDLGRGGIQILEYWRLNFKNFSLRQTTISTATFRVIGKQF
jgi:hypothetical protein